MTRLPPRSERVCGLVKTLAPIIPAGYTTDEVIEALLALGCAVAVYHDQDRSVRSIVEAELIRLRSAKGNPS